MYERNGNMLINRKLPEYRHHNVFNSAKDFLHFGIASGVRVCLVIWLFLGMECGNILRASDFFSMITAHQTMSHLMRILRMTFGNISRSNHWPILKLNRSVVCISVAEQSRAGLGHLICDQCWSPISFRPTVVYRENECKLKAPQPQNERRKKLATGPVSYVQLHITLVRFTHRYILPTITYIKRQAIKLATKRFPISDMVATMNLGCVRARARACVRNKNLCIGS